jgi:membrane protease YdiL (CAAX protease family)
VEWWQIAIILLSSIAGGVFIGALVSYLILRLIKRSESTFLNDIISWFVRKSKPNSVFEEPIRLTTADLLAEIKHNRKIASIPMIDKLVLFQSRVWDTGQYEVDRLPTNLREELDHVYIYIHVANSLFRASKEVSRRIPNLDENYRELCDRIAKSLDRIETMIEHGTYTGQLTKPVLAPSTTIVVKPRIGLISTEAAAYLLAIAAAQAVTVFYVPSWGLLCHIMISTVIIIHSALVSDSSHQRLLLPLAMVPLLRIISLAMPFSDIPPILLYHLSYAPVLAAAVFIVGILGYNLKQVGLSLRRFPIQIVVAFTGIAFGVAEYFILVPEPMIAKLTLQEVWLPALILLLTAGFMQEFVFRGALQSSTTEVFGRWGIVYVSLLYAFTYIGFLPAPDLFFVFVVALFYGWVVRRTGSLLGVALSHGMSNIALYLILPFFF